MVRNRQMVIYDKKSDMYYKLHWNTKYLFISITFLGITKNVRWEKANNVTTQHSSSLHIHGYIPMNEVITDSRELLKYIFNKLCEVHCCALTKFLLVWFLFLLVWFHRLCTIWLRWTFADWNKEVTIVLLFTWLSFPLLFLKLLLPFLKLMQILYMMKTDHDYS